MRIEGHPPISNSIYRRLRILLPKRKVWFTWYYSMSYGYFNNSTKHEFEFYTYSCEICNIFMSLRFCTMMKALLVNMVLITFIHIHDDAGEK